MAWRVAGACLLLTIACRPTAAPPVLRVAMPWELVSLDPHVSDTTGTYTVLGNVYEPLVVADPGLGLRPGLARRWYNPDPLTWMFDLDGEARFHSGKRLGAADVVYSIKRILADTRFDMRYFLGDVAEVEAAGPLAVRLRLRRPSPILLNKLGHVYIVPAGATRETLDRDADGTGVFRVVAWESNRRLELAAAGGRRSRTSVQRIQLVLSASPEAGARLLLAGEADMALLGLTPAAAALPPSEFAQHRRPSLQVKYLGFDLRPVAAHGRRAGPVVYRDRRVREAIHLAIDRNALVTGLPGHAAPVNQLVPRHVFGFDTELPELHADRERARSLLNEAGLGRGFAATLHTRQLLEEAAQLVAEQLKTLRIDVRLIVLPDAEYFPVFDRREPSLWLDRFVCTTGDSAELFENVFRSPDPGAGLGAFNETGFSDASLDAEIDAALSLENLPRRRAALAGVMRRVMKELPWVPLYTDAEVWALRRSFVWKPSSDYWLQFAEVVPAPGGR
jgi:peptide/nickel transport system substrate-binding protein